MRRLRAVFYFLCFLAACEVFPQIPHAGDYFRYSTLAIVVVLSVLTLWQWWNMPEGSRTVGFGIGRLPLPASWKRWLYDEPENR